MQSQTTKRLHSVTTRKTSWTGLWTVTGTVAWTVTGTVAWVRCGLCGRSLGEAGRLVPRRVPLRSKPRLDCLCQAITCNPIRGSFRLRRDFLANHFGLLGLQCARGAPGGQVLRQLARGWKACTASYVS